MRMTTSTLKQDPNRQKGSQVRYLLRQNTTCEVSGQSPLPGYRMTLTQQLNGEKRWKRRWHCCLSVVLELDKGGLPWKFAYCVFVLINSILLNLLCVWISLSLHQMRQITINYWMLNQIPIILQWTQSTQRHLGADQSSRGKRRGLQLGVKINRLCCFDSHSMTCRCRFKYSLRDYSITAHRLRLKSHNWCRHLHKSVLKVLCFWEHSALEDLYITVGTVKAYSSDKNCRHQAVSAEMSGILSLRLIFHRFSLLIVVFKLDKGD